jgi:beta-phosphoglucomutase-like phosphatase (HAD superfamily)
VKACEEMGVKPEQAMAVEDSFNGIRSAHAAGLFTVMVPDQLPPTEEILTIVDKKF